MIKSGRLACITFHAVGRYTISAHKLSRIPILRNFSVSRLLLQALAEGVADSHTSPKLALIVGATALTTDVSTSVAEDLVEPAVGHICLVLSISQLLLRDFAIVIIVKGRAAAFFSDVASGA